MKGGARRRLPPVKSSEKILLYRNTFIAAHQKEYLVFSFLFDQKHVKHCFVVVVATIDFLLFFCRFKNSSILPLRTKSCQESFFPRLMMTFSSPLKSIVLNCMKSFKKTRHVNPCLFWVEIYTRFWQWKIRSKVHIFPFTKSH